MSERDPNEPTLAPWRETFRDAQTAGATSCPTPEALSGLFLEDLAGEARIQLADHVVGCRRCTRVMQDLLLLHGEAGHDFGEDVRDTHGRAPWRRWQLAAAAAVVVVGVALAASLWERIVPGVPPAPAERGTIAVPADVEPPDGAVLRRAPERFGWPEVEGAGSYRLVLYDWESTPLWESPEVQAPTVSLAGNVGGELEPNRTYYWRVSVLVGVEWRQLPLYRFDIAP